MQKDKKSWKFFLLTKIPVYLIFIALGIFIGVILSLNTNKESINISSSKAASLVVKNQVVRQIRENDHTLIKPLLFTETSEESIDLDPLKQNITSFINKKKQEGTISSAAVYFCKLNDGNWMSINKGELFSPGSLMKIPTLISILVDAEKDPTILEKLIYFKKHFSGIPEQTITGDQLKEGSYYKVKDLLYFMIVFSDNDATALLNNFLNFNTMKRLFSDLQLNVPDNKQQDYQIDVKDCSKFLKILFNATYLNHEMSEFALDLLTKSTYREGLLKDFKPGITVAHKFGERNNNGEQQLHELGIFYQNNDPYLLGVMTKGKDHKILPAVLSGISDLIYQAVQPLR